jgi:hypothetical protein
MQVDSSPISLGWVIWMKGLVIFYEIEVFRNVDCNYIESHSLHNEFLYSYSSIMLLLVYNAVVVGVLFDSFTDERIILHM